MSSSQWDNLIRDLLSNIHGLLDARMDKTRFRSVCQAWRSSSSSHSGPSNIGKFANLEIKYPQAPDTPRGWFECVEKIVYCIEPLNHTSSSTKTQWLAVTERKFNGRMRLCNPFSGERMSLPANFPTCIDTGNLRVTEIKSILQLELIGGIKRGALGVKPIKPFEIDILRTRKVVVFTTQSNAVYLCALEYFGFSFIAVDERGDLREVIKTTAKYQDICAFKGRLYVVNNHGETFSLDGSPNYEAIETSPESEDCVGRHLVETPEALYLVEMVEVINDYGYENTRLLVYKLSEDGRRWVVANDIGGHVFFLSRANWKKWSFSVSPTNFPGWKPNCILFTAGVAIYKNEDYSSSYEDIELEDHKTSVYDMESGTVGLLKHFPGFSDVIWPPPSWIKC